MTHGTVVVPGQGRTFPYAGQPMRIIAEPAGGFDAFSVMEMTVPARFAGPVPHIHHGFDEGIYVVTGELLVTYGDGPPREAPAGSFCLAPRGLRHTFSNPHDTPAAVLGIWSPGADGLAFMRDVGAVIPPGGAPDPAAIAAAYERHNSVLVPEKTHPGRT